MISWLVEDSMVVKELEGTQICPDRVRQRDVPLKDTGVRVPLWHSPSTGQGLEEAQLLRLLYG